MSNRQECEQIAQKLNDTLQTLLAMPHLDAIERLQHAHDLSDIRQRTQDLEARPDSAGVASQLITIWSGLAASYMLLWRHAEDYCKAELRYYEGPADE